MNVREIVKQYLEAHGYDGLWNGEAEYEPCGCGLDDFEPCGEMSPDCVAAYRHGGLFFPTKPEAGQ